MNIKLLLQNKIKALVSLIILIYLVLGFFILPAVIKSQATSWVNNNLNATLKLENVSFNPLLFKLKLEGLTLEQQEKPLVAFSSLVVDFDLARTITNQYVHFKLLTLENPNIHLEMDKNKQLNFLTLMPQKEKEAVQTDTKEAQNGNDLFKLQLDKLQILSGSITFTDNSLEKPFSTTLDHLSFEFRDLSTLENSVASHSFDTAIDTQSRLSWNGGLYLNPFKVYGKLDLKNYAVSNFWESIKANYEFDLNKDLTVDAHIGFLLSLENGLHAQINESSVELKNLAVYDKQNQPLFELKQLVLEDMNLMYPIKKESKSLQTDFTLLVNEGEIKNSTTLLLEPLELNAAYSITHLPLDILNPILSQTLHLNIDSAFVDSSGQFSMKNDHIFYSSDTAINKIQVSQKNQPIIKANKVNLNGIQYDSQKQLASVKTVDVIEPFAYIHINKETQLNLATVQKKSAPSTKKTKKESKEEPLHLLLGPLSVKNGQIVFEDETLPIPFKTNINKLQGYFSTFNTQGTKPSQMSLEGVVGKYGHVVIKGLTTHNNIKDITEVKVGFSNISINDLTPYSGKFIGRSINEGKLNLDLDYIIKNAKLNAKNNISIEKIKLGENIESEEAVNLPLELAIAILEDSNGLIDISLPIKGDLDNPEFSIAPIVWKAFTNLILKAITAPFSLLGSLFGFDESEINAVAFDYGSSAITPVQKEPLDKLLKILESRKKLAIKLYPTYDTKGDYYALQEQMLDASINEGLKDVKDEDYKESYLNLLEESYESYDLDSDDIKEKFEGKEKFDTLGYEEALRNELIAKQSVTPEQLNALALKRVQNIKEYLLKNPALTSEQIEIDATFKQEQFDKKTILNIELDTAK